MFHSSPWKTSVSVLLPGLLDVGVDLVDTDLGVRLAAVVGDDHPVQTVPGALPDLVADAVLAVAAVLGVDVVVTGQPGTRSVCDRSWRWRRTPAPPPPARGRHRRPAPRREPRAAQQRAARLLLGGQGLVGHGGVERGGKRLAFVVVPVAVVVLVTVVVMPVPMPAS